MAFDRFMKTQLFMMAAIRMLNVIFTNKIKIEFAMLVEFLEHAYVYVFLLISPIPISSTASI